MTTVFAQTALLPTGWADNVLISMDDDGWITAVQPDSDMPQGAVQANGAVLPGMPNTHSHAFQRAMAGLTERVTGENDSFWTWRDMMYRFAGRISPDDLEVIATRLYIEMLKSGYTNVAEFHYLHHQPDGKPYDDRALTSRVLIEAALAVGIGITHLPVLYAHSGFNGAAPHAEQKRFLNTVDDISGIVATLAASYAQSGQTRIGLAHHSLRAVTPEMLTQATENLMAADKNAPIHIHIAEQQAEIDACREWSGKSPVSWLLDNAAVNKNWCLIHATHMDEVETKALAKSGAVAGLCPTTEANLGDGLFPLTDYLEAGGKISIGSDSHISVSMREELRWLEYGQRLFYRARAVTRIAGSASSGAALYNRCLDGGAQAAGRKIGKIETGCRADFIVLDGDTPDLAGKSGDNILDVLIFAANANPVRDVFCGGKQVVKDGHHAAEETADTAYRKVLEKLLA